MKLLITLTFIMLSLTAFSQQTSSRFDLRFGVGASVLGTGDMRTLMLENELNYFISNSFASSVSLGYGKSNNGVFETASFVQGNLNIYFSPFKNNKRNDFRIGTGLTYYNVSDASMRSSEYVNGVLRQEHVFEDRNSVGANIILENTYSITEKLRVGIKAFTQPYENGDMNSGILLKLGIKL